MQIALVVLGLATVTVAMVAWNRDAPQLPRGDARPDGGPAPQEPENRRP